MRSPLVYSDINNLFNNIGVLSIWNYVPKFIASIENEYFPIAISLDTFVHTANAFVERAILSLFYL